MTKTRALIGIGANLGDRDAQIRASWDRLGRAPGVRTLALSTVISTKPAGGPPNQPDFRNAAGLLETSLPPMELLELLGRTEFEGGRKRHGFWGARTLDLDLLLYGGEVIRTERLTVPHPRMAWRPFVLEPAAEIAPRLPHPIFRLTVAQLRDLAEMNFRLGAIPWRTVPQIPIQATGRGL